MSARDHWRPPLALVLSGALLGMLGMALLGLVALRYLGPEIGFRNAAKALGACILLATLILGWLLTRLLLRPVQALEAFARSEGAGPPPAHFGTRETCRTAHRVIEMTAALRDREATIRTYTDHVTHELKTPAAAIRAAVELLRDGEGLSPGDALLVAQIDSARQQIEAQLAALRESARARETRHLGHSTLDQVAPDLQSRFPTLKIDISGGRVPLPLSAAGLMIVLHHLATNAAQHGARGLTLAASDGPELVISDDGRGISDGNAGRVFDPFFTTRREEDGTGMGLTIVRNMLLAHGARIELARGTPGATFRILFPG